MSCEEDSSEYVKESERKCKSCWCKAKNKKKQTTVNYRVRIALCVFFFSFCNCKIGILKKGPLFVSVLLWLWMKVKLTFPTLLLNCSCWYAFNLIATAKQTVEHSHTMSSELYCMSHNAPKHKHLNIHIHNMQNYLHMYCRFPVFAWFLFVRLCVWSSLDKSHSVHLMGVSWTVFILWTKTVTTDVRQRHFFPWLRRWWDGTHIKHKLWIYQYAYYWPKKWDKKLV